MLTLALDAVTTAALLFISLVRASDRVRRDEDHQLRPWRVRDGWRLCGPRRLTGSADPGLLSCHLRFADRRPLCGASSSGIMIVAPLYQRPLDAILATWGLGIVIGQIITLHLRTRGTVRPGPITGTVDVSWAIDYSAYRIVMIAAAVIIAVVFTALLNGTTPRPFDARGHHEREPRPRTRHRQRAASASPLSRRLRACRPRGRADHAALERRSEHGPALAGQRFHARLVSGGSLLALALSCFVLGGIQVIVSTFVNPILGGLTIAICAAIVLRVRPEGFARA